MTPEEEATYYAQLAFSLREAATELLEDAQRYTKLSKELIKQAVA